MAAPAHENSGSSVGGADIPMENDWAYVHGRVDPGVDDNINLIQGVAVEESLLRESRHTTFFPASNDNGGSSTAMESQKLQDASTMQGIHSRIYLLALPSELIDHVLSYLSPIDLAVMSKTNRLLSMHAMSDMSWHRHAQDNLPCVSLRSPAPYGSFRELYVTHEPYWFLTKYKIWFCDYQFTGKIIVAKFDPRRGCIEAYRLLAERPPPTFDPWEADDEVIIHSFQPKCQLLLDHPVVHLDARSRKSLGKSVNKFNAEIPMTFMEQNEHGVFSNFMLARPVAVHPNMSLWPPPTIPARERVRNASQEAFVGAGHKPQKRSEVSTQAFRIRRWMEMAPGSNGFGVQLGEEVSTYATLDPRLYTPTEEKPYRGIWVGDYSGHGCEFLLMNQPDNEEPFDEASVIRGDDETIEEWEARKKEERIYRGSLEAIKLTGDPNVPRGQYTWVSDDISKTGFIRTATEQRFKGARVVKSRGHVAARAFRDDKYIESQLIMISHNRLAQYWVGFGHISFYERVDIDQLVAPAGSR